MSGGRLVVVDRAGRDVKRFPLPRGLATLGSDLACDIRVLVPRVAPLHATVAVLAAQAVVRNVGDGETLVNGRAVSVAALRHGDLISVGERALRWEYDEPRGRREPAPGGAALAAPRARARPARRSAAAPRPLTAPEPRRPASMPAAGKQVAVVQPQRRAVHAAEPAPRSALQATKAALWIEARRAPRAARLVKIEAPLLIDRTKRAAIMLMTGRSPAARRVTAAASPAPRRTASAGARAADRQVPSPPAADAGRAARSSRRSGAADRGSRRSARTTGSLRSEAPPPAAGDSRSSDSLALRYSSSPGSPAARRSIRGSPARRPARRVESYSVVDLVSLDSVDTSGDSVAGSPGGRRARSALGCSTPYAAPRHFAAPDDACISVNSTRLSRTRSDDADDSSPLAADTTEDSSLASARSGPAAGTPETRRSPEPAGTPVLSIRSLLESSRGSPAPAPRSSARRPRPRPGAGPTVAPAGDSVTPPGTARLSPEAVKNKHSSAKRPLSKRSIIDDLDRSDIVKQLFSSPVKRKLSRSMVEPSASGKSRRQFRAAPADELRGVRGLFARAPRDRLSDVRVKAAFGAPPRDDLSDVRGVRRLFQHAARRSPTERDPPELAGLFADRSEVLFDALVGAPPRRAVYSRSLPARSARRPATRARSLRGSVDEIAGDVEGWLERELQRRLRRPAPAAAHSTPLRGRAAAAPPARMSPIPPVAGSARSTTAERKPAGAVARSRRGLKTSATLKVDLSPELGPPRRITRNGKAAAGAGPKLKTRRNPPAAAPAPPAAPAPRAAKKENAETPKRTRTRAAAAAKPKLKSPKGKVAERSQEMKKKSATKERPAGPAETRKRPAADAEPESPEVSPKNVRRTRATASRELKQPRRGRGPLPAAPAAPVPAARPRRAAAASAGSSGPGKARPANRERKVRFAATPEPTPKRTRGKKSDVRPIVAPEPEPRGRRARPAAAAPADTKGRKRKVADEEPPAEAEPQPKRGRRVRDAAAIAPAGRKAAGAAREAVRPTRAAPARGRKAAAEPAEKTVASAGRKRKPQVEPSPVKAAGRSRRR